MKTFLAVLFLVACAAGQTSQQMKDQTMTLPYPLYQKRGFIAVTSDGVGHWCETDKASMYTPAITLNKNGSVSCPAGSHVVADTEKHIPKEFLEPEPMDVPAIKDSRIFYCGEDGLAHCDNGEHADRHSITSSRSCSYDDAARKLDATCGARYTCADKFRVLLTAEDGSKHCVKFPKE